MFVDIHERMEWSILHALPNYRTRNILTVLVTPKKRTMSLPRGGQSIFPRIICRSACTQVRTKITSPSCFLCLSLIFSFFFFDGVYIRFIIILLLVTSFFPLASANDLSLESD